MSELTLEEAKKRGYDITVCGASRDGDFCRLEAFGCCPQAKDYRDTCALATKEETDE